VSCQLHASATLTVELTYQPSVAIG